MYHNKNHLFPILLVCHLYMFSDKDAALFPVSIGLASIMLLILPLFLPIKIR